MECMPKPQAEHKWLMQLVGEWEFENECVMGPNGEKAKSSGREVVRAIGDLWVLGEMTGQMPGPDGGEMTGIITLGFDPQSNRFIGSWIGSPMTHMFIYNGTRDASGKVLTLDCEGPSFMEPGKLARYQDIVEIRSPNERRLSSQFQDAQGKWHKFMDGVYKRTR